MLLYNDLISGSELFTDAFKVKEVDNVVYEIDGKLILVKEGADVDIGANPSAEEQEESVVDGATQVIDIVHFARLIKTSFDKKTYLTCLKSYLKDLKQKLLEAEKPETLPEKEIATYVKDKLIPNFNDFEFYNNGDPDSNGMTAMLNYREDGVTPYLIFWKHGTKQVKL